MSALLALQNALARGDEPTATAIANRKDFFPGGLWQQWLWTLDARTPISARATLNESHLAGLAICRLCAAQAFAAADKPMLCDVQGAVATFTASELLGTQSLPEIGHTKTYSSLSMRVLQQQLTHTTLHIHALLSHCSVEDVQIHLAGLLLRVGQFCATPSLPYAAQVGSFDDLEGLEASVSEAVSTPFARSPLWTTGRVRSTLDNLLLLFRLTTLILHSVPPPPEVEVQTLHEWHREAGMDSFNELSMRWDLQPGAVLAYMHAHSGLFNAVSQVIYFHFPDYERRIQLPLAELNLPDNVAAVHTVPVLLQLEPHVELLAEEMPLTHPLGTPTSSWRLIITAGQCFLLLPNGRVMRDKDARKLFAVVTAARKSSQN